MRVCGWCHVTVGGFFRPRPLAASVPAAHCPQCDAYEGRVMGRAPGETLSVDVVPCAAFAMSDAFRDWAVGQMRKEVGAQISGAGLDRMAMVKTPGRPSAGPKTEH
jgi:hypothetical protein